MINLVKPLDNKLHLIIFIILILLGCSKEKEVSNVIVRVNEAVLTEDELNIILGENSKNTKYREQFISQWIEREVLYQKAIEEGITKTTEYYFIIENSKKELASAMLIRKVLSETEISIEDDELENFYYSMKEDFRLVDDLFRLNIIHFSNFDDAVKFRTTLIESDWDKAVNAFKNSTSLINYKKDEYYYSYQLQPIALAKIISFMNPNEVSVIIESGKDRFTVVQLIEKIYKGKIPQFNTIKEIVKERYMVVKNKEFIQNYIEELISKYDVIKR